MSLIDSLSLKEALLLQLYATHPVRQNYVKLAYDLNQIARRRISPSSIRARVSELQRRDLIFNSHDGYRLAEKGVMFVEEDLAPTLTDDDLNLFGEPVEQTQK